MTFHQDIAAIQAAMAGCGVTGTTGTTGDAGEAGDAFAQAAPGLREGRRMFDTLAAQFDIHIGLSVICLPMGDTALDATHVSGN